MFNALKYIQILETVGFRRDQAEAQAHLVMAAINDEVATKSDMSEMRSQFAELKAEFAGLRANVKIEVVAIRTEIGRLKPRSFAT